MSTNTQTTTEATHNGVLEVSDLPATRVQRYAREADDVYFERKGGRTFLVAER
ncbi:MAG: hypothetical protein ACOCQM_06380 [Natronomonas sp.]